MVRSKNVLSVLMQCFAITALVTILWLLYGYSMAFDTTGMVAGEVNLNSFFGGFGKAFMSGVGLESLTGTIPESVFSTFQLTFAIITPALIVGAFAERMRFSAMLLFIGLWFTIVYLPIAHMVWSGVGGLLWDWGVLDFAGGTVVHINAGIAGLVCGLVLGKRKGYPTTPMPPHNLAFTVIGASMLWVGWFGFNAGSAVSAGGSAGMAMLVTQVATAAAALAWMFVGVGVARQTLACSASPRARSRDSSRSRRPPARRARWARSVIGIAAGVLCFLASTKLKRKLGYDDSLDVFGVHAIGGIVGAILTGVFAFPSMGGVWSPGEQTIGAQVWIQTKGVLFTVVFTGVLSFVLLKIVDMLVGLRVSAEEETLGLDLALHDERGYNL